MVIWNPPSPTITQTSASGKRLSRADGGGQSETHVPNPPEVMSVRGCSCL